MMRILTTATKIIMLIAAFASVTGLLIQVGLESNRVTVDAEQPIITVPPIATPPKISFELNEAKPLSGFVDGKKVVLKRRFDQKSGKWINQ